MKNALTLSILYILFPLVCFPSSPKMQRYTCNGEGKALGIKFSIEYPNNWTVTDGIRPHILKSFEFNDNGSKISFVIYVKQLANAPSAEQIDHVFQKNYVLDFYKDSDAKIIEFTNDSKIALDIRCLTVTSYLKKKVYDEESYALFKNNQMYFKNYHLQFNFSIMSNDQKYETMMKMFYKYNPIFKEMMYSLALNSRWSN